jgi:hypothetical protein
LYMLLYALFFFLPNYDVTLSNEHLAPALSRVLTQFFTLFYRLYPPAPLDPMIV